MSVPGTASPADSQAVQRVLIYRLGSLGDTVVALPALHRVARAFPDAERRLLTNFPVASKAAAASAVLDGSGLVDGYERYEVGTRSLWSLAALVFRIRSWRPQVLVYLAATRGLRAARRDALFFRMCGIRRIIGLPDTDDLQNNRVLADGALEAESARLSRTLAPLAATQADAQDVGLRISEEEDSRAEEVLRPLGGVPFVVVSLGTKLQANEWPVGNWQALLAAWQRRHPEQALVLIGAADEHTLSEEAASGWNRQAPGSVLNLCGRLSPRISAAVCARAVLFFGHDSGPMHLAACVGTPCVGIYSARHLPGMWFPQGPGHRILYHAVDCMGCGLLVCEEQQKKCILSITVDEVLNAAEAALRTQPSGPRSSISQEREQGSHAAGSA